MSRNHRREFRGGRLGKGPLILVVAVVLVRSAACGSTSGTSGGGKDSLDQDATLRESFPIVYTLDPAKEPEASAIESVLWPVYDRLLRITAKSELEPMLATKWHFEDH